MPLLANYHVRRDLSTWGYKKPYKREENVGRSGLKKKRRVGRGKVGFRGFEKKKERRRKERALVKRRVRERITFRGCFGSKEGE